MVVMPRVTEQELQGFMNGHEYWLSRKRLRICSSSKCGGVREKMLLSTCVIKLEAMSGPPLL